jgi:hypothetical protein
MIEPFTRPALAFGPVNGDVVEQWHQYPRPARL